MSLPIGNEVYLENTKRQIRLNLSWCHFEDEFEEMKFLVEVARICKELNNEAFERWRARIDEQSRDSD